LTSARNKPYKEKLQGVFMICPKCGSQNVQAVSEVNSTIKGFGCCKGALGAFLFGPIGWLCGLCGMGDGRTTTNILWVCENCGYKFR
jgi:predicted nucleic-acid-binding Zn-ribbon protein